MATYFFGFLGRTALTVAVTVYCIGASLSVDLRATDEAISALAKDNPAEKRPRSKRSRPTRRITPRPSSS